MTILSPSMTLKIDKVALGETGKFSPIFLDYLECNKNLDQFYEASPVIENFGKRIENKTFEKEKRDVLVKVLQKQYAQLDVNEEVENNILALTKNNTFTVTTGHQLNIFTGPMYFIYKIITAINTCKKLKSAYPEYNFVPVYWMASEDHDFEEINNFNLFGKKYEWNTDQKGAVGRFSPESIKDIIQELPEKAPIFEQAYLESNTLADAVRHYVNAIFGHEGLVVIDADNKDLKREFSAIIKDDIFNHTAEHLVLKASEELEELNYKVQVFPRPINFFLIEEGLRERIVPEKGQFLVNNTNQKFTEKEIEELIELSPEKFSPNVILRPVYQEVILPNLCYIGGPSEIAYWFQLKSVFDKYNVDFPILMPRNFGMIINRNIGKKIEKMGFAKSDLFLDFQTLKENYVLENSDNELTLEREFEVLAEVFSSIKHLAGSVDKSLQGFIGAEEAKTIKAITSIEKRIKKAEEQKHDQGLKTIATIKDKLFPNDGLQERTDNILNFYLNNPEIINELILAFDPFDFSFHVFSENE